LDNIWAWKRNSFTITFWIVSHMTGYDQLLMAAFLPNGHVEYFKNMPNGPLRLKLRPDSRMMWIYYYSIKTAKVRRDLLESQKKYTKKKYCKYNETK